MTDLCVTGAEHKTVTDNITGEVCCKICGEVTSDVVLVNSEVINYTDGANRSQNYPVNYQMGDKALGSQFTKVSSGYDKKLQNAQRSLNVGRDQIKGLLEFSKVSDKLNLPEYIIEEATKSFIYIRKKGFLKGRGVDSIVGACVYLFAKKNGSNITLGEVCSKLSINRRTLFAYYGDLLKILELDSTDIKISLPSDYLERLYSKFNFDLKIKSACLSLVKEMQDKEYHVGKNPIAIAAVGIYIACQNNYVYMSQMELSIASGISAVTIRNLTKGYTELENK